MQLTALLIDSYNPEHMLLRLEISYFIFSYLFSYDCLE